MRDDETIGVDERPLDDVALEALAEAHATVPPARLRARLVGSVEAEASAARARRVVVRWRAVGTIAATIALVTTGLLVRERTRTDALLATLDRQSTALAALALEKDDLARRMETQEKTLVGLRETLESQAQMLRVLSGPRKIGRASCRERV